MSAARIVIVEDNAAVAGDLSSQVIRRLAALGQVSSMLAHEITQPLTAINNYIHAGLIVMDGGDVAAAGKAREIFEKAAEQARRASAIISAINALVRNDDVARQPESLAIVVQDAIALARLGPESHDVVIRMAMDEMANSAEINRIQIQQVLVNLIRNAIDAVRGSALQEIVVATALSAAGAVEVSVADTGVGLPGEVVQDLFKPFVTTKPDGMGIGLAICKSIIDAHGGTIWWDANPRGGTIFRFTLPKAAGQPASP